MSSASESNHGPITPRRSHSTDASSSEERSPRKRRFNHLVQSPYFVPASPSPSPQALRHSVYFPQKSESASTVEDSASGVREAPQIPDSLHERLLRLKPQLIQETVAEDPWKLLVAVTLLNKTNGVLAIPVFWEIMTRWSTPFALSQATESTLVELLTPLGTQNRRAERLIALSRTYLVDPPSAYDSRRSRASGPLISPRKRLRYPATPISHLPGAGAYALDSYRIFCAEDKDAWRDVRASDKELVRYLKWKWAAVEGRKWDPIVGDCGPVDVGYVVGLSTQLERNAVTREQRLSRGAGGKTGSS
ncbi:DNA glycosylase [Mycena amicta]|nr:DNA glycosylase [Mycena amicta]